VSGLLGIKPFATNKRSSGKKSRVSKIPGRVDISERQHQVELRAEAGHREVDMVVSRESKACVAVPVERKTRFFIVIHMKDKTVQSMHEAVDTALSGLLAGLQKNLTYDNGLENALHELTNLELG
jgi:IS30 family transposase